MEPWEQDYIDAVIESKENRDHADSHAWTYKGGYDSSRWVEITLPDGRKHYVPKEQMENRSKKRQRAYGYEDGSILDVKVILPKRKGNRKPVQRYYADKVSFVGTVWRMIRRLLAMFCITLCLFGMLYNKPDALDVLIAIYLLASAGVVLHGVYYLLRCLFEGNLRL